MEQNVFFWCSCYDDLAFLFKKNSLWHQSILRTQKRMGSPSYTSFLINVPAAKATMHDTAMRECNETCVTIRILIYTSIVKEMEGTDRQTETQRDRDKEDASKQAGAHHKT